MCCGLCNKLDALSWLRNGCCLLLIQPLQFVGSHAPERMMPVLSLIFQPRTPFLGLLPSKPRFARVFHGLLDIHCNKRWCASCGMPLILKATISFCTPCKPLHSFLKAGDSAPAAAACSAPAAVGFSLPPLTAWSNSGRAQCRHL